MKDNVKLIKNKSKIKENGKVMFCFSYAGGGASLFKNWEDYFSNDIAVCPVQLPGREERFCETPYESKEELFDDVYQELKKYKDCKIYLYGHSMGAKIAYGIAERFEENGIKIEGLIVSGCGAPHIPDSTPIGNLPVEKFKKAITRYHCTPEAILQNKELFELFFPMLRADFIISESCVFEKSKISCPILALGGTHDDDAVEKDVLQWEEYSDKFSFKIFEGNHFFIKESEKEVLNYVSSKI